jgi:hypothetical protein
MVPPCGGIAKPLCTVMAERTRGYALPLAGQVQGKVADQHCLAGAGRRARDDMQTALGGDNGVEHRLLQSANSCKRLCAAGGEAGLGAGP